MNKKGFQLKSGNKPSFLKMSGASPFKEDDNNNVNVSTTSSTTTDETNNSEKEEQEYGKVPEKPDKPLAKAGKVLFNSIAGGLNAIQKNKIKKLQINFDKDEAKRKEEADAKTPGENAVNDIMKGTGIWKPLVPFDPNKSKK
tara:strand:- start:47 stop:472 length:426 start_codon:yes stop_codon:yes gene_type:complete